MRLIFVDTETNDHPSQRAVLRIVSMTWLVARLDGTVEKRQNYLVKPEGFRIAPGATRIHGITEDQARKEGRPIKEVLGQWVSDLRAPGDKTLVGHYIQFDIGVIAAELNRHHFDLAITGLPTICTMHGNVWEWCASAYDADYSGRERHDASRDRANNRPRALRGGSWVDQPAEVRSAYRYMCLPTTRGDSVGFRLARSL